MPGRIATLQRQARELGRLRSGTYNGRHPERSETWIVTSHAEHYVRAAAEIWGGTVEQWQPQGGGAMQWRVITPIVAIDAILPPGDPLSQANELWTKGGRQRFCDGMTEQRSDQPCLCRAQFGDSWYEQDKGTVCAPTSRLNVVLPQMPDIGAWRVETHSFYAANEIAAHIDLILTATDGRTMVPIRLRIEPRQIVRDGKTKKVPVIAVELRGATAGQLLGGAIPTAALNGAEERPALPPPPAPAAEPPIGYLAEAQAAGTLDGVRAAWKEANEAGYLTETLKVQLTQLAEKLTPAAPPPGESTAGPDADLMWQQIVAACPEEWTLDRLEAEFAAANNGVFPGSASGADLAAFLELLRTGQVTA